MKNSTWKSLNLTALESVINNDENAAIHIEGNEKLEEIHMHFLKKSRAAECT